MPHATTSDQITAAQMQAAERLSELVLLESSSRTIEEKRELVYALSVLVADESATMH
jgi:hypothetical protein